jgi:F0F1-type ATP synthase membrane subunit b/b'
MSRRSVDERGQAFTLEAVVSAVLLLTAIAFALQVTIVTPLSASTSSQHIENQQAAVSDGLLAAEAENGTIKETLLYWNSGSNSNTTCR